MAFYLSQVAFTPFPAVIPPPAAPQNLDWNEHTGLFLPARWSYDAVHFTDAGPDSAILYPGVLSFVTTTINVDGTNTTDETANISNAIAAAASGSASVWRRFLLVPSGGTTVKISSALQISTKHHFILDLGGCTLKTIAGAAFNQLTAGIVLGHGFGGFWDGGVNNFIITNGTLWQNNPSRGVYSVAREQQANIEIAGGTTVNPCHDGLIYGMTLQGAGGDNLKLGGTDDLTYNIHGFRNTCPDAGRMGFTVIYGHDHTWGTLGANTMGDFGYGCIDIEPNSGGTNNDCTNIFVDNNTWNSWVQLFASINGSSTPYAFDNIKIRNNLVANDSLKCFFNNTAVRTTNLELSGNRSTGAAVSGPVVLCDHIDGLTIIHNTQPLLSGSLSSIAANCTAVVSSPNP